MEENNSVLSGDINCLKEIRQAVLSYTKTDKECEETKAEERRLEKELNLNKKNLSDEIEITVKRRRSEVAEKFNAEIDKDEDKLKKVKNKREKAKEIGVRERISEETSDLTAQNNELKNNIKTSLKADHLPAFCGTAYYFTIYFTKGAFEVLICALTIIVSLLLLPAAIYVALPLENLPDMPTFAITYFIVIVLVFFLYKIIGDKTKQKHRDALKAIRTLKDQMSSNKKQIRKIARAIRNDKNEEMYGLGDFDTKIGEIEVDIAEITKSKEAALKKFEDNVKSEIIAEIENREMPRINELEASYNEAVNKREALEGVVRQAKLKITSDYEPYIGKDNMTAENLGRMIGVMETGKAATISEAIAVCKTVE